MPSCGYFPGLEWLPMEEKKLGEVCVWLLVSIVLEQLFFYLVSNL